MSELRSRLYIKFDPMKWPHPGLSTLNRCVLSLVLFSILVAILETEPETQRFSPSTFLVLNYIFAVLFSIEYIVRLWVMGESPRFAGVKGRIRYGLTFASLVDLFATLALWIGIFVQLDGFYAVILRLVRVLRVLTLARNSEWAVAIRLLAKAVASRNKELILSFGMAGIVMLVAATMLFVVEGDAQPESFGSIPRAMWWAMATLTTIGYGDVFPVTVIGKMCASIVAITSVAIVAMPTGIMAAAFSDAFQEYQGPGQDPEAESL